MDKPSDPQDPSRHQDNEQFLNVLAQIPDARRRYQAATREMEKAQRQIQQLSALRAHAVAEAYDEGLPVREVARQIGVSPARVHQLIQEAKTKPSQAASAPPKRASRKKGDGS